MQSAKAIKLDQFTTAYIEAALWSSMDNDDRPLDENYSICDLADEALAKMISDCQRFQEEQADNFVLLASVGRYTVDQRAGHDFWLTRNGHGAGFWDGDWEEACGERLTQASKVFGSCDLYIGDDGKIYCA